MICFAFVYSRLCYGGEIYGNTYQTQLHILSNKILRILQNKPRHTHVIELYKTYNINAIYDIHKLQILVLVDKFFHHKKQIPIFNSYFNINNSLYHHNTRRSNSLHIDSCGTSIGLKSIKYKGPKLWNELPSHLLQFYQKVYQSPQNIFTYTNS